MRFKPRYLFSLIPVLLILVALGYYFLRPTANPNVLWNFVSQQCVPNQQQHGRPDPCIEVNEKSGFVVFKDMNGPLQYLLMPTARVTGVESPLLLETSTPNYFEQAWQARHFMADKYGRPIDDSNISLAINSEYGRSQNQFHIHISCLLPDVKTQLGEEAGDIGYRWQPLPTRLKGHTYMARKVSPVELGEKGAFRLLAEGLPEARENMGHFGMAMVSLKSGDFLLLASQSNLLLFNFASTEEIQDHNCAVLNPPPH